MSASQFPPEAIAQAEAAEIAAIADTNFQTLSIRIQQAAAILEAARAVPVVNGGADQVIKMCHLVTLAGDLVDHAHAVLRDLALAGQVPLEVHGGPDR